MRVGFERGIFEFVVGTTCTRLMQQVGRGQLSPNMLW